MKKTGDSKTRSADRDDLLPEYHVDYCKARPNRFARRFTKEAVAVVLDPDVSQVFSTSRSVNLALRAIIHAIPKREQLTSKE